MGRSIAAATIALAVAAGCSTDFIRADQLPKPTRKGPPPPPPRPTFECALDVDCAHLASSNPCRIPRCLPGVRECALVDVADDTACEDGSLCTLGDRCQGGVCQAGSPLSCDDSNGCTSEGCDPNSGCVFANTTLPCDDGNGCTTGDRCFGGACVPGLSQCACVTQSDCAQYEDGNLCNGTLVCSSDNTCVIHPATVVTCDTSGDGPCLQTECRPLTGNCAQVQANNGSPCDDGDACTVGSTCSAGLCTPGTARNCNDGSPCTDDSCQPNIGCLYADNSSCPDCTGMGCLACNFGVAGCATGAPVIANTCCAAGDTLVHIGSGTAAEAVDIEVDDQFAYLCGGFGVRINRITAPANPAFVSPASSIVQRCQRVGIGPKVGNQRVFYLAHHGDSWVMQPSLWAFSLDPVSGVAALLWSESDSAILFEGMAWHDDHLFVAAHGGGVRVYATDPTGVPSLLTVLTGFDNAWKIAVDGDYAYVADGEGGLKVVDIADPLNPAIVQSLATAGLARDVDVGVGRVYVAMGGDGLDVFDATIPDGLTYVTTVDAEGSVQAVSADGNKVALAAWSHVRLLDAVNLQLLGTEDLRLFPRFDQVFGVHLEGDLVYAAEWEGLHVLQYREGYVGSDIFIEEELLQWGGHTQSAKVVAVRNRGKLELVIDDIQVDQPAMFSVDKTTLAIPPGGANYFEVLFTPPAMPSPNVQGRLIISTNDPDSGHSPFEMHLIASNNSGIDVGDSLLTQTQADFGFLDQSGSNQVSNLQGKVIILAYFALF